MHDVEPCTTSGFTCALNDSRERAFAVYPSLQDAAVIVTGGASGIGMEIVRAFAGQKSRVGLLDFDVENIGNLLQDSNLRFRLSRRG